MKGNKIDVVNGEAYFVDENNLKVMTEKHLKLILSKMLLSQLVHVQSKFLISNLVNV